MTLFCFVFSKKMKGETTPQLSKEVIISNQKISIHLCKKNYYQSQTARMISHYFSRKVTKSRHCSQIAPLSRVFTVTEKSYLLERRATNSSNSAYFDATLTTYFNVRGISLIYPSFPSRIANRAKIPNILICR